jgi:HPt (histidine-containing phosphotransfer) domain-containing protein
MEREFREYERKMNSLLHTMHEALETCNTETTSELRELNTALANQGEVIHTQAITIASLTSALDTCNAKWQIFEGEIDVVHDKVAALENSVCRCAQAPAPDRVPSPHFSQADSLESYRTPPIATPPRENSTPLPVAMANAVLESDEENRPPLDYETGSEADDADATLVAAEIAYRQEVSEDTTRQLVRARRRVPLAVVLTKFVNNL